MRVNSIEKLNNGLSYEEKYLMKMFSVNLTDESIHIRYFFVFTFVSCDSYDQYDQQILHQMHQLLERTSLQTS